MAKLYFRIASDWQEVVRLRQEIDKLKATLKTMNGNQSPQAFETLNKKLAETSQKMNGMIADAAKARAEIDGNFKKKIFNASQVVNGLTEKIISQRAVIKDIESDVKRLGEAYRVSLKTNKLTSGAKLAEYNAARKALDKEKAALFGLTQQQAEARLSIKKLRDEYALYNDSTKEAAENTNDVAFSWGKALAVIGGGTMLKGLVSDMIRVRGEFQAADTAIQTLLGDKEKADALMSKVREYAKISPLEFSDVTRATQMMLGFNIEAEKVPRFLSAIGDVSMGETGKFNSLTLAFSQMSAAGKLMGQDLNQMINAGFNPLQIMADKTGKSIATLKDEMSKGAISAEMVQQAFIDATSAGGKFYNMSENASKTINGQISMMHDAMDAAFNELGTKSEGVIIKGIQMTTSLVKNYETIGKVLVGLVTTYGTYRTAVMLSTIATSKHTLAEVALTNVRVLARKAQLALNASMLANPYVLLATAIGSLVSGLILFKKSEDKAAKASTDLSSNIQKETDELDKLFGKLKNTKTEIDERKKIIKQLNSDYPGYISNLLTEKSTVEEVASAYEYAKEKVIEYNLEKSKNDYLSEPINGLNKSSIAFYKSLDDWMNKLDSETQKGKFKSYIDKIVSSVKNGGSFSMEDIENAFRASQSNGNYKNVEEWIEAFRRGDERYGGNILDIISGWDYSDLEAKGKGLEAFSKAVIDANKEYEEFAKAYLNTGKSQGKQDESFYKEDYENAKKAWEKAKKELEKIEKDKGKFTTKQYQEAKKNVESTEKAFKDLGGITGSALTKQENKAKKEIKEQEKINDQILSLRRQNQQDKINLMKDGKEKEIAQINLNYQKELDTIRKNEKKIAESQDGKLTSKQVVMFSKMRGVAKSKKQHGIDEVNEDEVEKYKKLLEKYQDYVTKYSATKKKFDDDKKKMQEQGASEEQLNELDYQRDSALNEISEEFAMREDSFKSWMDSIANMSIEKLREQLALAKKELEDAERNNPNDKGLAITRTKVVKLEKAISSNKTKRSVKDWQDLYKTLGKVDKELGEIGDSIGGVAGEAIKTAGSITTASLGMIRGILDLSESSAWAIDKTAKTSANAIKMIENASVILAVIGAAMKIAMKIADLFSEKSSYEKYQETREIYESYIDTLDKVIDRRLKLAETLTGKDADVAYKEALELYKEQESAARILGKQYLESRKKRNHSYGYKEVKNMSAAGWEQAAKAMGVTVDRFKLMMNDKMTGLFDLSSTELINLQDHARVFWAQLDDETRKYLDQIIEGVDASSEVIQQSLENYTGTSFDSFSDGILEQLYEIGAKSEDIFNDMSDNIRKSLIKAMYVKNIEPELKEWYDLWGNSIKDDSKIDEDERDELEKLKKNLVNSAISQVEEINKIWGESSAEQQEASRGFGTEMTHEDAGELSGRFTAMYESNLRIEAGNQQQTTALTELNGRVSILSFVTDGIRNIANDMRDIIANSYLELMQISENTGNSAKYLKSIQSDIAEVKNNTSKL